MKALLLPLIAFAFLSCAKDAPPCPSDAWQLPTAVLATQEQLREYTHHDLSLVMQAHTATQDGQQIHVSIPAGMPIGDGSTWRALSAEATFLATPDTLWWAWMRVQGVPVDVSGQYVAR